MQELKEELGIIHQMNKDGPAFPAMRLWLWFLHSSPMEQ